jgi:mannose-1-phosphate guanylyltransferase
MKTILLCAGFGTRLFPYTKTMPKCLMQIKGKPLLEIWLEQLINYSIGPFLINGHYLSHKLTEYIENSKYYDQIRYVYEKKLLGTAGTLINNINFYEEEDGLFIHADNYCITNFKEFLKAHYNRPKQCLLTMMTFKPDDPSKCGMLKLNSDNIIIDYIEKPINTSYNIANGAIYILSKEFLKILKKEYSLAADFSNDIIPNFKKYIYTYENKDILIDIGTVENFHKVNRILEKK